MAAAFCDKLLAYDVEPEDWRKLDVSIGEPAAGDFCDNSIKTYKYNPISWLPKSLFEQMRRLANQFFLVMGILMAIGTLKPELFVSPINPGTTLGPLALILLVTSIKEGCEDLKRHKSDNAVNNAPARIIPEDAASPPGTTTEIKWRDVRPGQIVSVKNMEDIPADLILLWSSEGAQAYVETANIDGETNLKIKKPASDDQDNPIISSMEQAKGTNFSVEFEPPNGKVHTFEGTLRPQDAPEIPLDATNFLLRGSVLRNTGEILGVVAYTGRDTRLVRNSRDPPSKFSEMERMVNKMIMVILAAMVTLTTVTLIASLVWGVDNRNDLYYICERVNRHGVPALFMEGCDSDKTAPPGTRWFTFFIIYTNFVPLSLYVTIEFCNLVQAFYVDKDLDMYDDISDTPALARTSNANADIGMIAHIFSDKTGTLTQNVMTFKNCAVNGIAYGDSTPHSELKTKVASSDGPERDLVTIMAVCHTVVPETLEDGTIAYRAESPDEEALVAGAADLGMAFRGRSTEGVTLDAFDGERTYEVLVTLPFDSHRKRMSALVKYPDGTVKLLCKGAVLCGNQISGAPRPSTRRRPRNSLVYFHTGADNIVFGLASEKDGYNNYPGGKDKLDETLAAFAREGLRTLVLAQRILTEKESDAFRKQWRAAETAAGAGVDRKALMAAAAATVERDLQIVGATAIEDKLQEGAPDCIAELAEAGIKLWVLTGDKVETAIQIGYSTKLLTQDMYLIRVPAEGAEKGDLGDWGVTKQLEDLQKVVKKAGGIDESLREAAVNSDHLALVVEGATAVEAILGDDHREQLFLTLAQSCKAVVACRVSPAQKRLIVGLVKQKSPEKPITLAIGDGANDVGMIQEASVGVGISGKEGRQAVNNSDFAIAQFRFLKPLLLNHGRRNYRRMSTMIIYSFFKNIALVFVIFFFQADNGWSGSSLYNQWVYSGYNFFVGLLPFYMGFFGYGNTVFFALTQSMMLRAMILIDSWNWLGVFCAWFQYVMLYSFTLFMAQAGPYGPRPYDYSSFISYDFYGVAYRCFGSATFWLVALFLVPVACAALQLTLKLLHLEYYPDVNDIGREVDKGFVDGTKPTSGDAYVAGFSLAGLFDCKRAEAQVSHKDLTATISGMDSPGRLGVQDSDQAQAAVRYNRDQAAEQSFYAPKKNGSA